MTDKPADRCPICASSEVTQAFAGPASRAEWRDGRLWRVDACATCGHRFTNPQPDDATLAEYYSSGYPAYTPGHGLAYDISTDVAAAKATGRFRHVAIHPGMRILDVGCGAGDFLRVARALGADVQGVEPSAHGVAACQEDGLPVFHGDLTDFLRATDKTFDLVTANHVFEHHPDPVRLLSEMRIAAGDGVVWVAVPNAGCAFSRMLRTRWHSADLPVHLQHFSAGSLRAAFDRAGLSVDRLETKSENSLAGSLATLLRWRLLLPHRVTTALFGAALSNGGWLARRIDAKGGGEALLASAHTRHA